MVVTRGRTAEAATLMRVIQDSGCVTAVFKYLEVEELGRFSVCNRTIYDLCLANPRLQAVKKFLKKYSKSWHFMQGDKIKFADECRVFQTAREGLDDDFVRLYAPTEMKMLQNIASWCGGWDAFMQSRMEGASRAGPDCEKLGDKLRNPCKPVVIYDIHCDDQWQ